MVRALALSSARQSLLTSDLAMILQPCIVSGPSWSCELDALKRRFASLKVRRVAVAVSVVETEATDEGMVRRQTALQLATPTPHHTAVALRDRA